MKFGRTFCVRFCFFVGAVGLLGLKTALVCHAEERLPVRARTERVANVVHERLGRGVVAVRVSADSVMVGWRYLSSDAPGVSFRVYRDGLLVTPTPISVSTQFFDYNPSRGRAEYEVYPVTDGREDRLSGGRYTLPADAPTGYVDIPLL